MSEESEGFGPGLVSNHDTESGINPEYDTFIESSRQDCVDARLQSLDFNQKFMFGTSVAAVEHIAALCRNYKGNVTFLSGGKSYDPVYPGILLGDPEFMCTKHIRGRIFFDPMEDYNYPDHSAENAAKELMRRIKQAFLDNPREPSYLERTQRYL